MHASRINLVCKAADIFINQEKYRTHREEPRASDLLVLSSLFAAASERPISFFRHHQSSDYIHRAYFRQLTVTPFFGQSREEEGRRIGELEKYFPNARYFAENSDLSRGNPRRISSINRPHGRKKLKKETREKREKEGMGKGAKEVEEGAEKNDGRADGGRKK